MAVAAFLLTLALPVAVPASRAEGEAAPVALTEDRPTMPAARMTAVASASTPMTDAGHAASMMLVGSLLIGIGSMVRRAV